MKFNWKRMLGMFVLCTTALSVRAFAFECGDYIKLGTYNQSDIFWRIVSVDGEKLTLMSDEIITLKAFDAKGTHTGGTDFHKNAGNGLWSASNLRTWLNSADSSVNWGSDPKPASANVSANPYDTEPGFLSNFTAEEKEVLTTGTYETVLNYRNAALKNSGDAAHLYSRISKEVAKNFDAAYKQTLTDTVFIPSTMDIQTLANGIYTYGMEYQVAPLARPLKSLSGMGDGSGWFYWLRDAMFTGDDSLVRCMRPDNTVEYDRANNGTIGVRPMCYVKSNIAILSGDGSKSSPYVLRYVPQIRLNAPNSACLTGSIANVELTPVLLPDGATIKVYRGSEYLGSTTSNVISFEVKQGANIITAEVYDANGELALLADPIRITGFDFQTTGKVKYNMTFDKVENGMLTSSNTGGFSSMSSFDNSNDARESYGKFEVVEDPVRGKLLKLKGRNTTTNCGAQLHSFPSTYKVTTFEMDFSVETLNVMSLKAFGFKTYATGGTETWISPLMINSSGDLKLQEVTTESRVLTQIEQGKWYNLKLLVTNATNAFHVILTEEGKAPQLLCYNEILAKPFNYIKYGEIAFRNTSTKPFSMSVDNIIVQERVEVDTGADDVVVGAHLLDDGQTVSVSLNNTKNEAVTPMVIVATYQDKKLKSVAFKNYEVAADSPARVLIKPEEGISADDTIKVFGWTDFDGMIPLGDVIPITQ